MYETKLRENALGSAQVLLTDADLADRERYLNARSTLLTLLKLGVVPVINENDTVVNDEIKFGDNEYLGRFGCQLVEADALVIPTDQHGLYTADPRKDSSATFVHEATAGDVSLEAHGRWRRNGYRTRRHDHQGAGRQTCRRLRCIDRHRVGSNAPTSLIRLIARRAHWHLVACPDRKRSRRASSGLPITFKCVVSSSLMMARRRSCKARARACCPSACCKSKANFRGEVIAVHDLAGAEMRSGFGQLL